MQPTDGIKIENIFNCIIHEGIENVNSTIDLSMNLEIFSERCILVEIFMGIDNFFLTPYAVYVVKTIDRIATVSRNNADVKFNVKL